MDIQTWQATYSKKLEDNSHLSVNGECTIWNGYFRLRRRHQYGETKAMWPGQTGRQVKLSVHRLAYFLSHPEQIGMPGDCSHMCHNTLCINADHIGLEPSRINKKRQTCVSTNICPGHAPYSQCLLDLRLLIQVSTCLLVLHVCYTAEYHNPDVEAMAGGILRATFAYA
jgi:hypothetical protein